jgi:hypothetical protein
MAWLLFIAHSALLIGLFAWLDHRQNERYNLFSQWTQVFSKMLGDDMRQLCTGVQTINSERDELRSLIELELIPAIKAANRR